MGTVNIASLATSQAIGYSDAAISRDDAGAIALGNFVFNVDQTVGAGQDNYVLTYDDASGEIGLEAVASSGISNVVEDTTPQLGGTLDANDNKIEGMNLGTAALPAIVPTGATNNGIYWTSITNMSVSVSGAEYFRFGSTGIFAAAGGLNFGQTPAVPFAGLAANASAVATFSTAAGGSTGAAVELIEMTAPSSPATNYVRLYAEDNGSGKTRLMALFATGVAQEIAIEP